VKKILIFAAAVLAFALNGASAQAEPEIPILTGGLEVQVSGAGKITGTGIDCGSDCADSRSWRENEMPPVNRLTAVPGVGWSLADWSGCVPVSAQPTRCDAGYALDDVNTVTARFVDVQAPNVYLNSVSPGEVAANSITTNVVASDNDQVTRVEYLIDGSLIATSAAAPWYVELDTRAINEGNHFLAARAFDRAGNQTVTANWPIRIDHTGPEVTLESPVTATNAASPSFAFNSASEDFNEAECAIQRQGETEATVPCEPGESYSETVPAEGIWEFFVRAEDEVGNETEVRHSFVVDRTAPALAFTAGPVDGSVVAVGDVSYAWSVSDALPVRQECAWDNGEVTACEGSASRGLTAGLHHFRVSVVDQAGNRAELTRSLTVKKDGNTPDPDPDPDPIDRVAPKARLFAPKQSLRAVSRVLRLNVRCDEACAGRVTVIARPAITFSGRVSLVRPGVAKLRLRPTSRVRKRLRQLLSGERAPRALRLTARARLRDQAGNSGRAILRFRVGRPGKAI